MGTDSSKQNRQTQGSVNALSPGGIVQSDNHSPNINITKDQTDSPFEGNNRIDSKLSPQCSTNKLNKTPTKSFLPKPVIDSSSSEYSENESKLIERSKNGRQISIYCLIISYINRF